MLNCQKLKTIVKRNIDQKLRLRNFDARNERIGTGAVVTSRRGTKWYWKRKRSLLSMESRKGSVREETSLVSGTMKVSVQNRDRKPLHPLSHQHQHLQVEVRREKGASEVWSPSGKTNRQPCKNFLKCICTKSPCVYWHPPECHRQVEGQPSKKPKKDGDNSAVAILKRQLGCVSHDVEPPESATISRKGTQVMGPIRRVRFTRAALRQANIRESKGPSLKKIQVKSSSSAQSVHCEICGPISRRD